MGKIGDRINKLSTENIPLTIYVGREEINLIFNPMAEKKLVFNATNYAGSKVDDENDKVTFSEHMVRYFASACLRDEDGNTVWESPDDININDLVFSQLQSFFMKHIMGDMGAWGSSLTEVETKK